MFLTAESAHHTQPGFRAHQNAACAQTTVSVFTGRTFTACV